MRRIFDNFLKCPLLPVTLIDQVDGRCKQGLDAGLGGGVSSAFSQKSLADTRIADQDNISAFYMVAGS